MVIETCNLTKRYGDFTAVSQVNLTVKKGEIFGFLGVNGAGKTTTIRMLLGLITSTLGACYLNGQKVARRNLAIWNQVGYLVEKPHAYPQLTVKENLEIFCYYRGIKRQKILNEVMEKLKLMAYASCKAANLSTGNKQRLGLAKAIIHQPAILILDEPTNGLDPLGIMEMRDLLKDLAENQGVTILMSSHKLDEIARIATKIAIIHQGRLIKEITKEQLAVELKKVLVVQVNDQQIGSKVLAQAGYQVQKNGVQLLITDQEALNYPDKIACLLVEKGCPPTLLKVQKENLEDYFLRIVTKGGESSV